jgi:AcrR family transcriptional regulator
MPKAFSEQERARIRERLMQQGYAQFSAYGLKKTSIEELATAAGISKAAFYLFFESKEALFMDVVERAEENYRKEILAAVAAEAAEASPRARLVAVFRKAFTLWRTIPILQVFTRGDYDQLSNRIPLETIQEHTASDQRFLENLIETCRNNGIPMRRQAGEISGMMYVLFLTVLHEDDFGLGGLTATLDQLLELVAAFCLGEVEIPAGSTAWGSGALQ